MGEKEVEAFLTHLAVNRRLAESTQNQALGAILFLYRHVLEQPLGSLDAVRASKPKRLPTVRAKDVQFQNRPARNSGARDCSASVIRS